MPSVHFHRGNVPLHGLFWPKNPSANPSTNSSAIVICHGFTGRCDSPPKRIWAQALSSEFAVLSLDFAGCGKSGGRFEDTTISSEMADLRAAFSFLQDQGFSKFGVVGHSLGGVVALCEAAQNPAVAAVCAIAAPFGHERYPDEFMTVEEMAMWKKTGFISHRDPRFVFDLKYAFKTDQARHDMAAVMPRVSVPVLALQGTEDELVPKEDAEAYGGYPNVALEWISQGDHRLLEQSPQIGKRMLSFFKETLGNEK